MRYFFHAMMHVKTCRWIFSQLRLLNQLPYLVQRKTEAGSGVVGRISFLQKIGSLYSQYIGYTRFMTKIVL